MRNGVRSRLGLDINLDGWGDDPFRTLFNEELGAIVQVATEDRAEFADLVARHGLIDCAQRIAPADHGAGRARAATTAARWSSGAGTSCSTPGGR